MAKVLYPITACFKKPAIMENKDGSTLNSNMGDERTTETNPQQTPQAQPGMVWKVSSGLFNIGSGAIGLGVGSVKWAASKTYNVGSGVVTLTQNVASKVGVTAAKIKPKKE